MTCVTIPRNWQSIESECYIRIEKLVVTRGMEALSEFLAQPFDDLGAVANIRMADHYIHVVAVRFSTSITRSMQD